MELQSPRLARCFFLPSSASSVITHRATAIEATLRYDKVNVGFAIISLIDQGRPEHELVLLVSHHVRFSVAPNCEQKVELTRGEV